MTPHASPPSDLIERIRREPRDANGWLDLGRWLAEHVGATAAVGQVEAGLRHVTDPAPLLEFIAVALTSTPSAPVRIRALNRLAALRPHDVTVLAELGFAVVRTAAAPAALKPLQEAVRLGARGTALLGLLASLELAQGIIDQAELHYRMLLEQQPDDLGAWAGLHHIALRGWDWDALPEFEEKVRWAAQRQNATGNQAPVHVLLSVYGNDPPALLPGQRRHAPPTRPRRRSTGRLRIGYLSSDLRTHAVGVLMAGLFEAHDRSRVELFLYNYGPRTEDPYRTRMQRAAEHWRDLNDLGDIQATARIAADQLDVLIELTGHTSSGRLGIVAPRPAPVQIHYLGHAGALAVPGIDYYLADAETVPPEGEAEFAETVLRLPRCFMVTDHKRPSPVPTTRADVGLPDDAIVLVNYNQGWKIRPPYVDIWLAALARHPRAVLWIRCPSPDARARLVARAERAGVRDAARRLIDCDYGADGPSHAGRVALADLALDQLPYSSHSIAAELLWAGVPLLSQRGQRFAGRVAASLLRACDLDSFITDSVEAYAARLEHLLNHPEELAAAKRHLQAGRATLPLFDTEGFARDLEDLLFRLFE